MVSMKTGAVNCVQFNEEATVVLSGSLDGTVRIWDIKARKPDPFQVRIVL